MLGNVSLIAIAIGVGVLLAIVAMAFKISSTARA
jgi:hypothetical protein